MLCLTGLHSTPTQSRKRGLPELLLIRGWALMTIFIVHAGRWSNPTHTG